jgi:hypothetical protein
MWEKGTMRTCTKLAAALLIPTLSSLVSAQQAESVRPIPRLPNGDISYEAVPGERGVWNRGDYRSVMPDVKEHAALRNMNRWDSPDDSGLKPLFTDVPFQPWARELYLWRQQHEIEPYGRCKPTGAYRNIVVPYGTDIVQAIDEEKIYIFFTGGFHGFRTIYMDGRAHPADMDPSYGGHSVGHWEDDVLVIDTVGFNERGWIDAYGLPNTTKLHVTEKITRLDADTASYEMIVDDPGAYTAPFSTGMLLHWTPDRESFQFLCQDGNLAQELMVGEGSSGIDRTSSIVP